MGTPRWLVDEMLGRLARYLRFLGHDTEWIRGASDDILRQRAGAEGRVLLTRDRVLAARTENSLLIRSPYLTEQLGEVFARYPELATDVRFDRCSLCNGGLQPFPKGARPSVPGGVRDEPSGPELYRCSSCGHEYWEGSHTARIRQTIAAVRGGSPPL